MAKKKVSNSIQERPSQQNQDDLVKPQQQISAVMDSKDSEKLEKLKSLNQRLLKETFERRQQVDSLQKAKASLELELTRSSSEREVLQYELDEKFASFEIERTVVSVFVALQVGQKSESIQELKKFNGEKELEIGNLNEKLTEIRGELAREREVSRRVYLERDEMKQNLDLLIDDAKGLTANLIELEKGKKEKEREMEELRIEYHALMGERNEREGVIELIKREKDLIERSLRESNMLVEEVKNELLGVLKDKEGIEEENNVEMVRRRELESDVSGLNEMVVNLRKDEDKWRANFAMLEKECVEGEELQKDMRREIDQVTQEAELNEKRIEGLIDEKKVIEKDLAEALKQLDGLKHKIEGMVNEKNAILEDKGKLNSEFGALQNQLNELKAVILELEESGTVQVAKIKNLESEVGEYRTTLKQVKLERDEIQNCLDTEKHNAAGFKKKIEEMDKEIDASLKDVEKAKAENVSIYAEKIELGSQCELLKKEIISLENILNELDSMKGKVALADANSELVLNLLKDTAAFCSIGKRDAGNGEKISGGEETKSYVMELEMIKNAFEKKESEVENMKIQLEVLQNSVTEAQKKKSFWTVFSSATTLLAAVSLAYVARGH